MHPFLRTYCETCILLRFWLQLWEPRWNHVLPRLGAKPPSTISHPIAGASVQSASSATGEVFQFLESVRFLRLFTFCFFKLNLFYFFDMMFISSSFSAFSLVAECSRFTSNWPIYLHICFHIYWSNHVNDETRLPKKPTTPQISSHLGSCPRFARGRVGVQNVPLPGTLDSTLDQWALW